MPSIEQIIQNEIIMPKAIADFVVQKMRHIKNMAYATTLDKVE